MDYIISNDKLTVIVNSKGAQMMSVKYLNAERLWQNENGSWGKHAPILFPHAGQCSIVVNGVHYPDQFHGFGRDLEFDLVSKTDNSICQVLKSNEFTKTTYPYDFELYVQYKLMDDQIEITQTVKNPTSNDLYFFIGAHESYKLDNDINNYYLELEKDEDFRSLNKPMNTFYDLGKGKLIDLANHLLDNSGTLVFGNINSREVVLRRKGDNAPIASTRFNDFPNLLIWHSLGSQMVCIEPWMNLPDSPEDYEKELKDKNNVICVKGWEEKVLVRTIRYFPNK